MSIDSVIEESIEESVEVLCNKYNPLIPGELTLSRSKLKKTSEGEIY